MQKEDLWNLWQKKINLKYYVILFLSKKGIYQDLFKNQDKYLF